MAIYYLVLFPSSECMGIQVEIHCREDLFQRARRQPFQQAQSVAPVQQFGATILGKFRKGEYI
jgi:hypothetical protein